MRDFVQPRVLTLATMAALGTSLVCYPRLTLWLKRSDPVWFLELVIFFGAAVLWGFVFAWHTRYTQRPVITLRIEGKWITLATLAALLMAAISYVFFDPAWRQQFPEDYPANINAWIADVLFEVGLIQLFLVLAPFDWLMRLTKKRTVGIIFTIIFGVFVLMMKIHSSPPSIALPLVIALISWKMISGYLVIQCYLRGGWLLTSWWVLILETRHLVNLH